MPFALLGNYVQKIKSSNPGLENPLNKCLAHLIRMKGK